LTAVKKLCEALHRAYNYAMFTVLPSLLGFLYMTSDDEGDDDDNDDDNNIISIYIYCN